MDNGILHSLVLRSLPFQESHCMRRAVNDRACGSGTAALACFLATLVLLPAMGMFPVSMTAQTINDSFANRHLPPFSNFVQRESQSPPTGQVVKHDSQSSVRAMPKNVVRILVDDDTGQLWLFGAPEDIEIVKKAILDLKRQDRAKPDFDIVRVSLKYQLADVVAEILLQSMRLETQQSSQLKISRLHFPEAILLTGPPSVVQRAKK